MFSLAYYWDMPEQTNVKDKQSQIGLMHLNINYWFNKFDSIKNILLILSSIRV